MRGATRAESRIYLLGCYFNPRTPCGVRLIEKSCESTPIDISIHAPHAGCDAKIEAQGREFQAFQSTHPMRGATAITTIYYIIIIISIHAPHAGCDFFSSNYTLEDIKFQSTHPMRGATFGRAMIDSNGDDFNPRTPCGVRPLEQQQTLESLRFQSTHPMRGATF